jgi:hypothetical protein
MVTSPEHAVAPLDDRSYLYPHAWTPTPDEPEDPWAEPPWPAQDPAAPLGWGLRPADTPSGGENGYSAERALIGDALRIPAVWCDFGSCIARFTHPAALGESDVRHRAVVEGWRQDALGRLACPQCLQVDPAFRVSYPVVPAAQHIPGAEPDVWVPVLDELAHELSSDTELDFADGPYDDDLPADAGLSAWDSVPLPRLSLAAEPEPGRLGWWRRRETGRHRLSA